MTLPWEATLNQPAAARLAIMSGLPGERLRKALPALAWAAREAANLPTDVPTVRMHQAHAPNAVICRQCTARRGISAEVRAHLALPDITCHRHHIWQAPEPCDISAVPEIERAQRTLRTFQKAHGSHIMTCCIRDARWIISDWISIPSREPELEALWQYRRTKLGLPTRFRTWELPAHIMTHPEVVALASALAPIHQNGRYLHSTSFRPAEFNAHLRASLGLQPRRQPSTDPINRFIHMVRTDRARWRYPKSAMITETASPRPAQ